MTIKVSFYDKHQIRIDCTDRQLLSEIQAVTNGKAIRMQQAIRIHHKASPKLKNWNKMPFSFADGTLDFIKGVQNHIQKRIETIAKIRAQYGNNPSFDYEYKGKYDGPLEHQKIMFNGIVYTDACALLADPGTCKTASYLWGIDKRIQRGQVKKALVVTLSPLKENVLEEMGVQVPHLRGVVLKNALQGTNIVNKTYKAAKRNKDYDIYISNYESLFSLAKYLPPDYYDMVVLDEAHRAGTPTSRQTKELIKLFDYVPYKYIVTATLHANNMMSFFMPFRFLGPDTVPFAHWMEFRRRFMFTVDPDGHIWKPAPGAIRECTKITGKLSLLFKKEDCLDLPPLVNTRLECNMAPSQAKLYNKMKADMVAVIDNMCLQCDKKGACDMSCRESVSAKNALVLLTKLRQICCGFYINTRMKINDAGVEVNDSNIITLPDNPKLDLMMNTISCIPQDRKIIIWCTYVHAIEMIRDRLKKAYGNKSTLTCYGTQDAYKMVQEFKKPEHSFVVAMPSKMGVGQNMQFSNYQMFFNNSYSYIQREQAIGRQHRKGQLEKVTTFDFLMRDSIDEVVFKSVMNKYDLSIKLSRLSVVVQKGGFDPGSDNDSLSIED